MPNKSFNPATLENVLNWGNMRQAWRRVRKQNSAAGPDHVTVKRWNLDWETRLHLLIDAVYQRVYTPLPPKQFYIPKKSGGKRLIQIFSVTDRVLQRAFLQVVSPVWERVFLPSSFGFRPKQGVANAVTAVVRHRERGYRWVLDADITRCFDNLRHKLALDLFQAQIPDRNLRWLLKQWLNVASKTKVGLPMGAVVSPLLCNVILHQLDLQFKQQDWHLVRYADDFIVQTQTEDGMHAAKAHTESTLATLHLTLHPRKTTLTHFDSGFTFLGVNFKNNFYSYTQHNKRIEVAGPTVRVLHAFPPTYYEFW